MNQFDIESSERQFKSGRILRASTTSVIDHCDPNTGTLSYKLVSMSNADCNCLASLYNMFECELCIQRVVCSKHAMICSVCKLIVCNKCSVCAVPEEEIENPQAPSVNLCMMCYTLAVESVTPKWIVRLRKILEWLKP